VYIYKPKRPKTQQEHVSATIAGFISWLNYYIKQYKKTSQNIRHRNKVFNGVSFFGYFLETKIIRYWSVVVLVMILALVVFICMIEYNNTLNKGVLVWYEYKKASDD
jgi:hypothetical protein